MRYWREFLLIIVLLSGLEIAVGGVSRTVIAVAQKLAVPEEGVEEGSRTVRLVLGCVIAGLASGSLAISAWARLLRRQIVRGTACPACQGETKRLRRMRRDRFLATVLRWNLQRRSCQKCGWSGLCVL